METFDDLVLKSINKTRPTDYATIVRRIERSTGCKLASIEPIQAAGRRLVAAGAVRIIIGGAIRTA